MLRNLRHTLLDADPRFPANREDGAIGYNSLRLKAIYQSINTRSSILNVSRGPRPAFDYNGI